VLLLFITHNRKFSVVVQITKVKVLCCLISIILLLTLNHKDHVMDFKNSLLSVNWCFLTVHWSDFQCLYKHYFVYTCVFDSYLITVSRTYNKQTNKQTNKPVPLFLHLPNIR
jgi:uncharacterized membrane protein